MSINEDEKKSVVGLKDLYIAEVTVDSASAYTAGTPEILAPACNASLKPVASMDTQYADDQPFDISTSQAETDIELTVTGVPSITLAKILGAKFDATTGRVYDNLGTPSWFALGFKSLKSNGKYRFFWFMKVKFIPAEEGMDTKADKATPKPVKLVAKAVKTTYQWSLGGGTTDGVKRVFGDEDTDAFSGTDWFTQVQVPNVGSPSALALSSSDPTDGATGVATSKDPTLTFNNALQADAPDRVVLMKATDHSLKAATITLDATKKIITIDPTTALSSATEYYISYAVEDIYGDTLSGVINFTTA